MNITCSNYDLENLRVVLMEELKILLIERENKGDMNEGKVFNNIESGGPGSLDYGWT